MNENREQAVASGRFIRILSWTQGRRFRFPLGFSERIWTLTGLDFLALNGALAWASWLSWEESRMGEAILPAALPFLFLNLSWFITALAFDLYDPRKAGRYFSTIPICLKAMVSTVILYLLISYALPAFPAPLSNWPIFFLFVSLSILALRGIYILVLTHSFFGQRLLIFGAGRTARMIHEAILSSGHDLFSVVGMIDDDTSPSAGKTSSPGSGFPDSEGDRLATLGDHQELFTIVEQHQIDGLILAPDRKMDEALVHRLADCLELGVEIIPMPLLFEQLTGRVPVEHIGGNFYASMPIDHPGTSLFNRIAKRLTDILLASAGLLFLLPITPLIAMGIYVESPGSIFYTQERVGRGGRRFRAYKFRSMVPNAERDGAVWAQKNDCRVTRVGRLLRKTHVDEFPQFLNILRGEMSAVGPRPERPEFVEELAREIPFYRVRHAVKPGMAGWGLVQQGYGASKEDALRKLEYDLYYIKHQSLWFDLGILIKTVIDTVTCRGRA